MPSPHAALSHEHVLVCALDHKCHPAFSKPALLLPGKPVAAHGSVIRSILQHATMLYLVSEGQPEADQAEGAYRP